MGFGSEPVVIAGVSTRAFAESARRAGVACASVDAFGDLDQKALLPNLALGRDLGRRYHAAAAAALSHRFAARAAAYVANFENHPSAVRRLGVGRRLLGNAPTVLARARDPWALAEVVTAAGARVPLTLRPADAGRADPARSWLRKPVRGGGGSGVRAWRPGTPLGARELVQERTLGVLASAVFVADGRRARVLGLSHQLSGDDAFGAPGHRYAGSIFPLRLAGPGGAALRERVAALADALTAAFGLRGVNGVDFVLRDGDVFVLELNPRYPSSAELVERATGLSIFQAHAAACEGELPPDAPSPAADGCWGKAIVYARGDVVTDDTRRWLERDDRRDVPFPGERIRSGHPICTVFARGATASDCHARLVAAAAAVEEELHGAGRAEPGRV